MALLISHTAQHHIHGWFIGLWIAPEVEFIEHLLFAPLLAASGVFPNVFLPGLTGQFIGIADTAERAQSFKIPVQACFAPPVLT
jgi:hypothetical protein